jgi:L-lactate dehydrogenase
MSVGIVGSGFVGATAAYALLLQGVGGEITLLDKDQKRAIAEADDIRHAVPFAHPMKISAGEYEDLTDCGVVIIAAGVSQEPGESRLALLRRNASIFREIVPRVLMHAPQAVLVIATNPVDIMTHVASECAREAGVSPSRVIGSGTTLDTARFRTLLGRFLDVDPRNIHAYVIGEHGDSEVLVWSRVTIAGMPLEEFCRHRGMQLGDSVRREIDRQVRGAAYEIIAGKGATYYGVGAALARITDTILKDQRAILTVSTTMAEVEGVCDVTLSLPHLIGGEGVISSFQPPLDERERAALIRSADVLCDAIRELNG